MPARVTPDRAALEIAYQLLNCPIPLEDMLKSRAQTIVLENVARRHMEKRARLDVKKLQANDLDD